MIAATDSRLFSDSLDCSCTATVGSVEVLAEDCFDMAFEATKGPMQRIRDMTGLTSDGSALVAEAFSLGNQDSQRWR